MKNNSLMTLFPLQLYFTILPIVGRLAMPVTGCVNPIPFEGLTGFSRGPIRTKYEAPIIGCRVLSSPLKDNPNTTVIYGNSIFSRLAMLVTGCVNPP